MTEEYGLMIIWQNALFCKDKIIKDLQKRFEIINKFKIEWQKEKFSKNLSRFYGENLPKNSFKEKHCGNGEFVLLILKDNNPIYKYRKTSKGKKKVNVNFFDSKMMYREWTGTHMIHATNDFIEFKHDLMMLLGVNFEDYLCKYANSEEDYIIIKQNVIGDKGFNSLEELFYVLNETINYVVLRNFQFLPEKYQIGNHGDIDILCENKYNMISICNAKKENKNKSRSRYIVNINNEKVYLDFRSIGDDYYSKEWEKEILISKIQYKNCFYIPNNENYKYSLLYHALVHKKNISNDYIEIFKNEFVVEDFENLLNNLKKYMLEKKYHFVDPKDISVFFNKKVTGKSMRISKILYFKLYFIKRIVNKIKKV